MANVSVWAPLSTICNHALVKFSCPQALMESFNKPSGTCSTSKTASILCFIEIIRKKIAGEKHHCRRPPFYQVYVTTTPFHCGHDL